MDNYATQYLFTLSLTYANQQQCTQACPGSHVSAYMCTRIGHASSYRSACWQQCLYFMSSASSVAALSLHWTVCLQANILLPVPACLTFSSLTLQRQPCRQQRASHVSTVQISSSSPSAHCCKWQQVLLTVHCIRQLFPLSVLHELTLVGQNLSASLLTLRKAPAMKKTHTGLSTASHQHHTPSCPSHAYVHSSRL